MSPNIIFRDEIILMAKNFVAEGEISCSVYSIEGCSMALAFLLWASKLCWSQDIAAKKYGDQAFSN